MGTVLARYMLCVLCCFSACTPAQPEASINATVEIPKCAWPQAIFDYSYVVFFDYGSSSLTSRSQSILADLALRWKRNGGLVMELASHTDLGEARRATPALGLDRAVATKAYLVSFGIEAQRVVVIGQGSSRPLVIANDAEPQNRRVEPHLVSENLMNSVKPS